MTALEPGRVMGLVLKKVGESAGLFVVIVVDVDVDVDVVVAWRRGGRNDWRIRDGAVWDCRRRHRRQTNCAPGSPDGNRRMPGINKDILACGGRA